MQGFRLRVQSGGVKVLGLGLEGGLALLALGFRAAVRNGVMTVLTHRMQLQ